MLSGPPHSDSMSSSRCVVFLRRSSSFIFSAWTMVSFTTMCWSSRTSMTNSLLNSLSMLTMMDLIDASHSTRTPAREEEGGPGSVVGRVVRGGGDCEDFPRVVACYLPLMARGMLTVF